MTRISFVLLALLLACVANVVMAMTYVHELTEETFEHDTQAATGATTGNWFVMFKSEKCGYCKQSRPEFDQVAAPLSQAGTNLAVVDCDNDSWLCKRFHVVAYPTFILFARGKQYVYRNPSRKSTEFYDFLTFGYQNEPGEPVAPPLTAIGKLLSSVILSSEEIEMIKEHVPALYYGAIGAVSLLGVMLVILLAMVCWPKSKPRARPPAAGTKKPATPGAPPVPKEVKKKQ